MVMLLLLFLVNDFGISDTPSLLLGGRGGMNGRSQWEVYKGSCVYVVGGFVNVMGTEIYRPLSNSNKFDGRLT